MAREILFRGKRAKTGEWVYGLLWHYNDKAAAIYSDRLDRLCWVALETVGQFTGLTDKNGKKIFEGDLLDESILGNDHTLVKIVIRNGCVGYEPVFPDKVHPSDSMWKSFWRQDEQEMWPLMFFTIVGNIHDNPELLNGKES